MENATYVTTIKRGKCTIELYVSDEEENREMYMNRLTELAKHMLR